MCMYEYILLFMPSIYGRSSLHIAVAVPRQEQQAVLLQPPHFETQQLQDDAPQDVAWWTSVGFCDHAPLRPGAPGMR